MMVYVKGHGVNEENWWYFTNKRFISRENTIATNASFFLAYWISVSLILVILFTLQLGTYETPFFGLYLGFFFLPHPAQ
jgi:hypothetical protein